MSFVGESVIKRLTCEGAFEEIIDVSPFLIRAVHFTSSRNLLISVREKGDVLPLRTISQRKLLVMDSDGNHIHEYEHDENGERLFTVIGRVATKHDAIYVTDYTSYDMDGSVMSLRYPNKVEWRYTGSSQPRFKFRPCDILVTENHRIVISDRDNNLIHILKNRRLCSLR
ncbi:HEK [Mytilus edulis]|uniref:HEK n=1 Tax=Mytilus edulis TaxID=6550 RepID=A0A8S3SZK0_MYTED|nr:HEK [Mytilus edulis]